MSSSASGQDLEYAERVHIPHVLHGGKATSIRAKIEKQRALSARLSKELADPATEKAKVAQLKEALGDAMAQMSDMTREYLFTTGHNYRDAKAATVPTQLDGADRYALECKHGRRNTRAGARKAGRAAAATRAAEARTRARDLASGLHDHNSATLKLSGKERVQGFDELLAGSIGATSGAAAAARSESMAISAAQDTSGVWSFDARVDELELLLVQKANERGGGRGKAGGSASDTRDFALGMVRAYDADNSGVLEVPEFLALLQGIVGGDGVMVEHLEALAGRFDEDSSGFVTAGEFASRLVTLLHGAHALENQNGWGLNKTLGQMHIDLLARDADRLERQLVDRFAQRCTGRRVTSARLRTAVLLDLGGRLRCGTHDRLCGEADARDNPKTAYGTASATAGTRADPALPYADFKAQVLDRHLGAPVDVGGVWEELCRRFDPRETGNVHADDVGDRLAGLWREMELE